LNTHILKIFFYDKIKVKVLKEKKMNLIPFYQDVISWNSFVGNDISNKKLQDLYVNLVIEESTEIFDSIKDKDPIEFIDGLCDSLVVGSFLMAVKRGQDFTEHKVEEGSVNIVNSIALLEELIKEDCLVHIESIISLLEKIANSVDIDTVKSCEEVMFSNWSKFPLVSEVNPESEVKYIENQGRYSNVTFSTKIDTQKNERFIFKDGNGKVVKPSTFKDPVLNIFVTDAFKILDFFQ
jgi:hypothetical protein